MLNLHEPFASSASELVAELLQYAVDQKDITPLEAQALLAGIVLDTKNFTVRTGSRTFEAAAFLRRAGADTVEVKKLFQADLDATILKYQVIQAAPALPQRDCDFRSRHARPAGHRFAGLG